MKTWPLQMSEKERRRLGVLARVDAGTLMDAARVPGMGCRQVKHCLCPTEGDISKERSHPFYRTFLCLILISLNE